MMQQNGIWSETFRIRADEMDRRGKLSPPALFNYLQETAGRHAASLGFGVHRLLEQQRNWMLSRFFMQIDSYPRYGEEITVQTWPCGVDRLLALRDFLVTDAGGTVIARATSGWLLIDLTARRILRLGNMLDPYTINRRAVDRQLNKLPHPPEYTTQKEFTVRLNDIDVNQHTNSVAYLEWLLEAVPLNVQGTHSLVSLEVNYQSEALYNEPILSLACPDENDRNTWLHGIHKQAGGEELARARSSWEAQAIP